MAGQSYRPSASVPHGQSREFATARGMTVAGGPIALHDGQCATPRDMPAERPARSVPSAHPSGSGEHFFTPSARHGHTLRRRPRNVAAAASPDGGSVGESTDPGNQADLVGETLRSTGHRARTAGISLSPIAEIRLWFKPYEKSAVDRAGRGEGWHT